MGLETSYYFLIHWLTYCCSIRWQKTNFTCDKFSITGWAGQLSMINATFLPSALNFLFTSLIHSSNKTLSIQLFLCDRYLQGSFLMFLKHLGCFALPITNIGSFIANGIGSCQTSDLNFAVFTTWTFLFSTDRVCLVNIDKTTRIRRRCKYSLDRN